MAPSAATPDSPSASFLEKAETDLQPFFILHKASSQKSEKKSAGSAGKTRRRINLSPPAPSSAEKLEGKTEFDNHRDLHMRTEAFEAVWSKIELTIKDALRDIHINAFKEINQWVHESFNVIMSVGRPVVSEASRSFPVMTDSTSKQLFTGLVRTKNMEFVDDLLTFKELGLYLKSEGYHVANLSSQDFVLKTGIGSCLRTLLRQFLNITFDAADISILATWYMEQVKYNSPLIIIIDDLERCCGSVLSDFILILSDWALKIPAILIMGVATTLDALRDILAAKALHHLNPQKFVLGSPSERMDAVVKAVLVNHCYEFCISYKVVAFMKNYFVTQDGTITSFMRALKIACAQHFFMGPLSFLLLEENRQVLHGENFGLSPEILLKHAFSLPSCTRYKTAEQNVENFVHGLSELKKLQNLWRIVVLCLYEAGNFDKIQLLDLLCESLDPRLCDSARICDTQTGSKRGSRVSSRDNDIHQQYPILWKGSFISRVVHKVRDLPVMLLSKLLKGWKEITTEIPENHVKVEEVLSILKLEDGRKSQEDLINVSKKHTSRRQLNIGKDFKAANEKVAGLIEDMIQNYLLPVECLAFHEIVCFKDVDSLKKALIGDPRRRIQINLLESCKSIQCSCCSKSGNTLSSSMHDSSIMYSLAQEHGDLINVHDWFQSFKSIVLHSGNKGKHKSTYSPSPKKRKVCAGRAKQSEAVIQARFCRAVTELQITGLIRMPGKRRTDYVQRVAFGL